jgi:nicotinate-nucleotide adenylyltransferase
MSIGIMGGTFDPIHLGHLRAAELARETLGLARVLFVPAGQPPHRHAPGASALDRWAMVCLATAAHQGFEASDVEIVRDGPSYAVDTVDALRRSHPTDDFVLIVGSDTLPEMSSWREPDRLFALCRVAVVDRPGCGEATSASGSLQALNVSGLGLDVSATAIRQLAAAGRSVRHLVSDGVADHILKRGLYR